MAGYICPGCSERGHYKNHCPSRDSICGHCKGIGHQCKHCEVMQNRRECGDVELFTNCCPTRPPRRRERVCSGCRELGHDRDTCPDRGSQCAKCMQKGHASQHCSTVKYHRYLKRNQRREERSTERRDWLSREQDRLSGYIRPPPESCPQCGVPAAPLKEEEPDESDEDDEAN